MHVTHMSACPYGQESGWYHGIMLRPYGDGAFLSFRFC